MRLIYPDALEDIGIWHHLAGPFANQAGAESFVDACEGSELTVTILKRPTARGWEVLQLACPWDDEPWTDDPAYVGRR